MTRTGTTDTTIARVQALLDKAESTPYAAEAEAFMAKAQELMARHAIDDAMLAASGVGRDQISSQEILVEPPYANAKSVLLAATASANRCRVVTLKRPNGRLLATLVGHESDQANVTVLFTALLVQAVRFMLAADVPLNDTPRRFRQSFLLAYAHRIGQRLAAADRAAAEAAQAEQLDHAGGRSISLVLASREAKVDRAVKDKFPNAGRARISGSSRAGGQSGRAAADRAALNRAALGSNLRGLPPGR